MYPNLPDRKDIRSALREAAESGMRFIAWDWNDYTLKPVEYESDQPYVATTDRWLFDVEHWSAEDLELWFQETYSKQF